MSEWECGVCGYIHRGEQPPEKCPVCEAPEKMFTEKLPESSEGDVSQEIEEQVDTVESEEIQMSGWDCGVCGYIHKEEQAPEKCPVCEAPEKMFTEKQSDTSDVQETLPEKQWRCSVSGYLHTGPTPPEKCPVCDATADQFEEVVPSEEVVAESITPEVPKSGSGRRWRCTVCGYLHEGEEPPEKCPVCGADRSLFVEVDAEGKSLTGEGDSGEVTAAEDSAAGVASTQEGSTFFNKIATLSFNFHLHSIHTHFPNGILPVIVAFLGLSIYFNIVSLEIAAFYNSIAVLIVLPVVILTGYIEWQKRYKGIKTMIFITKIICALIVLGSVNVLVFWRVIDPAVAIEGSLSQMLYFAVAAVALGAAGIAGHLGGKLAFASRS